MNPPDSLKHFAYAFLIALVGYVAFYAGDAYLRQRHGPWRVRFTSDSSGNPTLIVADPQLKIADIRIVLVGERAALPNAPVEVVFDRPLLPLPFGKRVFEELMWLPGTLTLDLFGQNLTRSRPAWPSFNRRSYRPPSNPLSVWEGKAMDQSRDTWCSSNRNSGSPPNRSHASLITPAQTRRFTGTIRSDSVPWYTRRTVWSDALRLRADAARPA